jgi:hypothetical protein
MWSLIASGVCAAGALVLFLVGRSQGRKALEMRGTETSQAAELATGAKDVAAEIGSGSFSRRVELKGEIECASPLKAEISGVDCVHFRSVVTREYEESFVETDKDGNRRSGARKGSEQVSRNERFAPFAVRDATGTVEVDPTGAAIDEEKVLSRFEPASVGSISIGSRRLDLDSMGALVGAAMGSGRRTVGYKLEEWALPVGRRVYVLGEASDAGGALRVAKGHGKGARFIVSLKSEEDLVRTASGLSTGLTIGAAALAAAAVVLAILLALGVVAW